ncbi:Modification methylase AplI [compost metagenome]
MTAYYNEIDPFAAQWLRNLIAAGHIASGIVDDRSITDVTASDLKGFTQCHFFAGIGGWSYALRLAGLPDSFPCWTGSPPCQPFSVVGAGLGQRDSRHLAPAFLDLVSECRPSAIFGEQVANAVKKDNWIDGLLIELEEEGYASGFAVLPACSLAAPHKRNRIIFGARAVANTNSKRQQRQWKERHTEGWEGENVRQARLCNGARDERRVTQSNAGWGDADWIECSDGKFRAVESRTFPLANGISSRVGRLRGYGNAIVPQVAAEFVKAFMECSPDRTNVG